jgi:hypothetical protein
MRQRGAGETRHLSGRWIDNERGDEVRTSARVVGHLLRYGAATAICWLALAVLPILVVIVLDILLNLFLVAVFIGGVSEGGLFVALLACGGMFLAGALLAIACVVGVLLLSLAFTLLCVMPLSVLTEWLCRRWNVRGTGVLLGAHAVAGLALATPVSAGLGICVALLSSDVHPLLLVGAPLAALATCVCTVFLFGLIVTTLSAGKGWAERLRDRFRAWLGQERYPSLTPGVLAEGPR